MKKLANVLAYSQEVTDAKQLLLDKFYGDSTTLIGDTEADEKVAIKKIMYVLGRLGC